MRRRIGWSLLVVLTASGLAWMAALRYRPEPVRGATALSDATCLACHADKSTYEGTAHRATSRPPVREAIAGRFDPGANELRTSNPNLHYRMDSTADGFTQTAVLGAPRD